MPPSAGACQTIDAALNPDCGRAGDRSSIITAIGWRAAAAGLTRRPVSGSGTRTGVGFGSGVGAKDGEVDADGPVEPWGAGLISTPPSSGPLISPAPQGSTG